MSCSTKALNRDFAHVYKSYTVQSEKWAARGYVFMKADFRQWVRLTNTTLVKLPHHVYMLISPGIWLIDAWFIPWYSISSYIHESWWANSIRDTVRIYSIDISVPIKEMFIITLYMHSYIAHICFKLICVYVAMCKLMWPRVYRGLHSCAQECMHLHACVCISVWFQCVWHRCKMHVTCLWH